MAGLGWHLPMRTPCTFRLERVACGKSACGTCDGKKPAHGPYWYAYWQTGGRARSVMSKRYIGKAAASASEAELRALFERRQQARADAARRRQASNGNSASSDYFNSRRPPPISVDFATIGAKPTATQAEAKQAYYAAAQKNHSDRGGSDEVMKRINVAWERIRQHFERQKPGYRKPP